MSVRRLATAGAVLVLLAVAGCDGDGEAAESDPTPSPTEEQSPSPTDDDSPSPSPDATPTLSPNEQRAYNEVTAAEETAMEVSDRLYRRGKLDHLAETLLRDVAMGRYLHLERVYLEAAAKNGWTAKGAVTVEPIRPVRFRLNQGEPSVTWLSCYDRSQSAVVDEDGKNVDTGAPRVVQRVTAYKASGHWKISRAVEAEEESC